MVYVEYSEKAEYYNEVPGVVYPIRVSKCEMDRHVNLLLTESNGVHHYSTTLDRRSLKR